MPTELDTGSVFSRLFDQAELARWKIEDVPWGSLDRTKVTPELIQLVREIVAAEATTFSATQRFLQEFTDDLDFTNWISVWFYEETKHPHVLLRWLAELGEHCDDAFLRRARVTVPFMKSRMATLVTNIVSEMVASARYMSLRAGSPEPVLGQIAARLAGDEARHAASFFLFAQRRLATSGNPDAERRDALKVLYLWSKENAQVHHPVNLFKSASSAQTLEATQGRIYRMVGYLIGSPLRSVDDVVSRLRDVES